MNSNPDSMESNDPGDWRLIEDRLFQFEQAWQESDHPPIEQFLETARTEPSSEPGDKPSEAAQARELLLLAELVKIDLEYCWKKDQEHRAEDYFKQFPQLADSDHASEIVQAELEARKIADRLPAESELKKRFGGDSNQWSKFLQQLDSDPLFQPRAKTKFEKELGAVMDSEARKVDPIRASHLKPGILLGRYELLEKIGQGAFAVVWRANDTQLKREIAVKILKAEKSELDESVVVRLVREGRAAAAIDHPGVVKIHEVVHDNDLTFIAEQLVKGPSLNHAIEEQLPTLRRAAEIVRDISRAVHAAHECGVIHRDIKPANILMANGNQPMLVDFGLACLDQLADVTLTKQGELLGTPAYMSPQQAAGMHHLVDARSDIYSVGAVLYHLLSGQLPFDGSILTTLESVANRPPSRTPLLRRGVDRDLETIVLKCLEKEPADRYQSAAELADDLQRYLDGAPIIARPVGWVERTWKWSKRHPRWAGMLIATFLLMAFLMGTLLQLRSVNAQRKRAELAERKSQELLLESTKSEGRLAMQRGKMESAVASFRRAIDLEQDPDPQLKMDLVEGLLATREIAEAKSVLGSIDVAGLPRELKGRGLLLTAQLELETGDPSLAAELFEQTRAEQLAAHERFYVDAMLAEKSLDAVAGFRDSLVLSPLKHHPRRMLVTLLLSLAEFDQANRQLDIGKQLFPNDIDFQLLDSVSLSVRGEMEEAVAQVLRTNLPEGEKQEWQKLCEKIHEFRNKYSHRGEKFGFDGKNLTLLARDYIDVISPCLTKRGFVFPPKIAARFSGLFHQLERFYAGEIEAEDIWPQLSSVVEIHPEGSLANLQLSTLLSQNAIEAAFQQLETVKNADGFVPDSRQMLSEIGLTLAIVRFASSDPKLDRSAILRSAVNAINDMERYPDLVKRFSENQNYCRLLVILAIEAFKEDLATEELPLRWVRRYRSNPATTLFQSLWFEAIVANRAGRSITAMRLLQEMLANRAEAPEALKAQILPEAKGMWETISQAMQENLDLGKQLFGDPGLKPESPGR